MDFKKIFQKITGKEPSKKEVIINQPAPDFSLPDENGNIVNLSQFKGGRDVMLFIIRGDFCPYCQMMLRTYQKEREKFRQKNIMLMSIGPGPVDINHEIVKKFGLDYLVLCDAKQETIKEYGALDAEDKRAYPEGMPVPASFLIDRHGIIRFCSRADKSSEAFNPSDIYTALEMLN